MNWALLLFLGSSGVVIVVACIVLLLVRHRFNRHHRVDRAVPTPAPLSAAVDPRAPGRLHRRLAKAAHTADDIAEQHRPVTRRERRRARHDEPAVVALAADIKAHAVELDARLALVARLAPAERGPQLRDLAAAVREVERAVAELARVSAAARTPSVRPDDTVGVADTRSRIGHLADAQGELDQVDADNGLVRPDLRGRPSPPPPPPPPALAPEADRAGRIPRMPRRTRDDDVAVPTRGAAADQ